MGRFNWIWRTLRTLSVVMCGVWLPSTASAFSTNELKNIQLGSCRVEGLVDTNGEWMGAGIAIVSINLTSSSLGPYRYSGGAFWVSSNYTERVNIDLDTIETCLGIAPGEVTNLIQTGADNSKTFVNQTNMGFTFSISDTVIRYPNDSNYVAGGTYSFYIGAASNAPTNLATTPGDGKVSVAFTAPTDTGGSAITDYEYQLDGGDWTTAITTSSPVVITGLKNGTSYSIKLRAVNIEGVGAESAAVTSTPAAMQTPSAAFAGVKADVESKMAANARTQLNDFATSTSSIVGSARSRFMNTSGVADSSDTALSGDVSSDSSDLKGSSKRVNSTADGKATSIIEVQYQYTETKEGLKSQNASGQIINEAKLSDSLTFGRFLGVTLGDGDAVGTNNIDIDFMGAQAGAYLVGNTKGGLVYDTYLAGSVIENKMGITTSLMTADSKYYSSMLTTGASITGTLQVKKIEIRPTLSTDFSYMFRETADFDVKVGSATSVEQAAYGDIAKAQITFAPEFRLPFTFGGSFWDETLGNLWDESSVLTATPNVKCRYLKQSTATEDCGQGLSLGFKANSNDGLLNLTAKAGMDRIGSETTSSLKLQFEQKF